MKLLHATTGLLACAIGLAATGTANAGTLPISRWEATNAAGTCQGALPQFAGTLRARPMAIGNEGAATAFVTCALDSGAGSNSKEIKDVWIELGNNSAASISITCTLVSGWSGNADFVPKTVTVAPGGLVDIIFNPGDLPGSEVSISMPNLSCALPPGALVYWIGHTFAQP